MKIRTCNLTTYKWSDTASLRSSIAKFKPKRRYRNGYVITRSVTARIELSRILVKAGIPFRAVQQGKDIFHRKIHFVAGLSRLVGPKNGKLYVHRKRRSSTVAFVPFGRPVELLDERVFFIHIDGVAYGAVADAPRKLYAGGKAETGIDIDAGRWFDIEDKIQVVITVV